MESVKTNEEELTSTMGSLLSTSKDEKNDASDSTPTSSTDAFTTTSTSHIAADDPISSTSSDVLDAKRTEKINDVSQSSSNNTLNTSPIMSSLKNISSGDHNSIVSEKDLLVMNITDTSTEKITENVDDIVQDLENLLGEPTTTFDFTIRPKDSIRNSMSMLDHKDISMDLDEFSMDFQIPEEKPKEVKVEHTSTNVNQTADLQNIRIEDTVISQEIKETFSTDGSVNQLEAASASVDVTGHVESTQNANKGNESSISNTSDVKSNLVEISVENAENPECEVSTENVTETNQTECREKNESTADITSTDFKETKEVEQKEEPSNLISPADVSDDVHLEETEKQIQRETLPDLPNSHNFPESIPVEKEEDYKLSTNQSSFGNEIENVSDDKEQKKDPSNCDITEVEEKHDVDEGPSNLISSQEAPIEEEEQNNDCTDSQVLTENVPVEEKGNHDEDPSTFEEVPMEEEKSNHDGDPSVLNTSKDVMEHAPENEEKARDEDTTDSNRAENTSCVEEEKQQNVDTEMPVTSEIYEDFAEETKQVEDAKESEVPPIIGTEQVVDVGEPAEVQESRQDETLSDNDGKQITQLNEDKEHGSEELSEIVMAKEADENSSINKREAQLDVKVTESIENQVEKEDQIETIAEMTPVIIESEDLNHLEPGTSSSEKLCQESNKETLVEVTEVEKHVPVEADTHVSQPVGDTTAQSQLEQLVTGKEDERSDNEEDTTVASMTVNDELESLENNVPDGSTEIRVEELTILKENTADSIENPSDDLHVLNDSVLNENLPIPSNIPNDSLTIFQDIGVAAEAAPSAIDENMEVPTSAPIEDFAIGVEDLVASTVEDSVNLQQHVGEGDLEVPSSSSIDNIKNLGEGVIENNILPLVMEDVPDLDVLNAISTLQDNKQDLMPEMTDNLESSDTLLASNSIGSEGAFAPCIESALPTVDEIFAEQSDQQPVELPDDNLETLLAVASLQGVCETDAAYSIPPVEDISYVPEEAPLKIQDEKIESLFEHKETFEEITQPLVKEEAPIVKAVEKIEKEEKAVVQVEEHVIQHQENKLKEPLLINVDDTEKDRAYSPKITIKPIKSAEEEEVTSASGEPDEKEGSKGSLKMTITKQSDTMHSILKIYDPDDDAPQQQDNEDLQPEPTVPKLIIKPIVQPSEQPQSPKMSTRSCKQVFSPSSSGNQRSASPRITIKPIVKPDSLVESVAPVKITIKPVLKPEEGHRQKHSPKLTIKPIIKPDEESGPEAKVHSPRVTIKPIVKPPEEIEQVPSPRITIKPIVKPETVVEQVSITPRVTIKPVVKPQEKEKTVEISEQPVERSSPKITIKPIVKPQEPEVQLDDFEESIKERIVLKINKGNIPSSSKELRKREAPQEEEKSEKLAKIKLKFSKEGGHPHIVQDESPNKRPLEVAEHDKFKRQRIETETILPGVTITPIASSHSKLKEMLSGSRNSSAGEKVVTIEDDDDDVTIVEDSLANKPSPIVISEESNQDSINVAMEVRDPISDIPVFEITPDSVKTINPQAAPPVVEVPVTLPAPRKRGRPRKVPLQVREDFKDPKEEEPKPVIESTRPKRSCRGQSVRTTLGIKPRKPRGAGRGRGSKRGMGTRSTPTTPETPPKPAKEPKLSAAKLKQLKEDLLLVNDKTEVKQIEIDDGFRKSPSQSVLAPPHSDNSTTDRADIVMYEEETRMSAETSSRAQTPAKQVVSSIPSVDLVEESQSSVQSTATTESVKVRKGPRLEVHQEPEGAVISADQLAEYYWSGGGPFMLQEQVAQFLGIKSFKRKYPNIPRRVVDMQERDFIRESGLAGEAMCDLGLTAVNSTDILDIMYSDFQDKYEEYCKHQRDRQAKDLTNKQKALSLAASQEKTKMDITQQAVQSAATWNANFNKMRRDQRKACMDLQTLTVHFPKGKMKQINKPKIGHYPVALVPGQFTDYFTDFTPTEINNLPLNTLCYDPLRKGGLQEMECDSQTDGSGSESDSSTSDSDSSYSGSSDGEDCTLCNKPSLKRVAAAQ